MLIIMNPPYGSLHLKILDKVIKACPNAEIVNLSPIRWLQDPLVSMKDNRGQEYVDCTNIKRHIKDIDVIPANRMGELFGSAQVADCGIYHIDTSQRFNFDFTSFINPLATKIINAYTKNETILKHLSKMPTEFSVKIPHIYGQAKGNGRDGIYISPNKETSFSKETAGGERTRWVNFETEEERNNFYDYLFTKFFRWLNLNTKFSCNVVKNLPFMPTYTHPWTDEMLYEYFGLTEDEIKEIEKCLL